MNLKWMTACKKFSMYLAGKFDQILAGWMVFLSDLDLTSSVVLHQAQIEGWEPEPLAPTSLIFGWIHLRGCKIPSFFNFLKKKENAQKKIICTALYLT